MLYLNWRGSEGTAAVLQVIQFVVQDETGLPVPTANADSPVHHIFDLPPDLIGKILSGIDDEER